MKLQRRPDKVICSLIFCFIFGAVLAAEEESRSSYIVAQENKRLHGYAVKRIDSTDEMSCSQACLRHSWCTSSNFKESSGNCELNNHEFSITADGDTKLTDNTGTTLSMFLKGCLMAGCLNGGSCLFDKEKEAFACSCDLQWNGEKCELDIDECAKNTHKCGANAYCNNSKGGYNCKCHPRYYGDGKNCEPDLAGTHWTCYNGHICGQNSRHLNCLCNEGFIGASCHNNVRLIQVSLQLLINQKVSSLSRTNKTQMVTIIFDSKPTSVLCHMGDFGCGDGGWTPVMKMDGNKQTFEYNSSLWSNKETFNLDGGKTGFDSQETKLPSYWNTSFSKICLGMKINDNQSKFIVINQQANSLYSLIADGQYRNTSLGRDTWKSLIGSEASLQNNCNKEGFNAVSSGIRGSKARIGIISNDRYNCASCDSRIGFGTGGKPGNSNSCGNEASHNSDNGNKHIKTMGYILVQ
ncbi:unnamed protein product [Porites lobata]|uniref:Uncharacterized protein n=1 Tax=Porites lobata TaxID=104759 RepID=A0ABN8NJ21_9CNID|nr:unnamed protein product [Porites lobata]